MKFPHCGNFTLFKTFHFQDYPTQSEKGMRLSLKGLNENDFELFRSLIQVSLQIFSSQPLKHLSAENYLAVKEFQRILKVSTHRVEDAEIFSHHFFAKIA